MRLLSDRALRARTWFRLLLPWPLLAAAVLGLVVLLVVGGDGVPLVGGDLGDSRMAYFAAPLFAVVAALASRAEGPFWHGWDRGRDRRARAAWTLVLAVLAVVPTGVVATVHHLLPGAVVALAGLCLGTALAGATLLGRAHCAYLPFLLPVVSMFTAGTPASGLLLGWVMEESRPQAARLVGLLAAVGGAAVYVLLGSTAEDR